MPGLLESPGATPQSALDGYTFQEGHGGPYQEDPQQVQEFQIYESSKTILGRQPTAGEFVSAVTASNAGGTSAAFSFLNGIATSQQQAITQAKIDATNASTLALQQQQLQQQIDITNAATAKAAKDQAAQDALNAAALPVVQKQTEIASLQADQTISALKYGSGTSSMLSSNNFAVGSQSADATTAQAASSPTSSKTASVSIIPFIAVGLFAVLFLFKKRR